MLITNKGIMTKERMMIALLTVRTSGWIMVFRFFTMTDMQKNNVETKTSIMELWNTQVEEKIISSILNAIYAPARKKNNIRKGFLQGWAIIQVVKKGTNAIKKLTFAANRLWITIPVTEATVFPKNTSTKTFKTCSTMTSSNEAWNTMKYFVHSYDSRR